jgi:IstB-like ATP binding protein
MLNLALSLGNTGSGQRGPWYYARRREGCSKASLISKMMRVFTAEHQRFWDTARRRLGDGAGTRALVGVLLLHRTLPTHAVIAGMNAALKLGSLDPDLVAVEGRHTLQAETPAPVPLPAAVAAVAAIRRPTPSLAGYDQTPHRSQPMSPASQQTVPAATALSDPAAEAAIHAACRILQLPTIRAEAIAMADAAVKQRLTHKAFLADVLTAECDERDARRRLRRVNEAKFPRTKRLTDFDTTLLPDLPEATLGHLATGSWIDKGEPLVLLGDSGTGKTHCETP